MQFCSIFVLKGPSYVEGPSNHLSPLQKASRHRSILCLTNIKLIIALPYRRTSPLIHNK